MDDRGLVDESRDSFSLIEDNPTNIDIKIDADDTKSENSDSAEVDEDDEENLFELVQWFSKQADILPSISKKYAKILIDEGVGSVNRLGKRIAKEGRSFFEELAFKDPDVDEIIEALRKLELIPEAPVVTQASPKVLKEVPVSPSISMLFAPADDLEDTKSAAIEVDVTPSQTPIDSEASTPHAPAPERRRTFTVPGHSAAFRGHRSSIIFRAPPSEVVAEAEKVLVNLKTAFESKMSQAIVGVLHGLASSIYGSAEKQRAYFVVDAAANIIPVFSESVDNAAICEKCLIVIALLCRHTDDSKTSICLENVKAFGTGGAPEAILASIQKHGGDAKVLEATCDAVRSLCCLESNRVRMGEIGLCEAIGRALGMTKFMHVAEICSWICRAIGHLCVGNDANRAKMNSVGACESVVAALQHHMTNVNVCSEACWAMRNLAPTPDNRAKFADEFGPESILSVMKSFASQEIFMVEACKALVACIENDEDEMITRIGAGGGIPLVLKGIKKTPSSENLARAAFNLLYFIATEPTFISKLLQNDILDLLSSTLQEHASDEGVAEWGCRTVHALAGEAGINTKMRNAGLCEMVVSCVQRQAMSATVSGWGCFAIGDLAADKANHSRLSQSGACEAVVGALRRHDDDDNVVFKTCHAIHYLTMTENNVSWMGANGGCEAITKALIKHTATSLTACRYALKALGSLGLHDEGNLLRFYNAGACPAVVTAMKTHIGDELVVVYACRAIYYLCTESQNVAQLGKAGAPKLVVTVLQSLAHNPDVVTKSCLAIYGLAVKTKTDKVHMGNTRKLVNKGAIECVVAAISKSPEDPELVRAGCMAIASLARVDENKERLSAAGAVGVVLNGFATHPNNERVFAQLAFATEAMCCNSDINKSKFAAAGIVDILLTGLTKHERNKFVAGETFRALITLSSHDACRIKIRSEAAVKICVKSIRTHEKEEKVAKWGCNWIYSCATDDLVRERLGQAKACEVVISALTKHAVASADVTVWGSKALVALSAVESNHWRFNNSETCAAVVAGLKAHVDDANCAEWACSALVRLAHNEQNRSRLGAAGACAAVSASLFKLSITSVDVTRLACETIFYLAQDDNNKQLLGAAGVCEILVTSLSTHINNAEAVDRVLKAIAGVAKYSSGNNDNATKLGAAGACELVVGALKTHIFNGSVVEWGCAAVASLADRNPRNQGVLGGTASASAAAQGVCALLVTVLVTHRSNAVMCAQASRAARALTQNHPDNSAKISTDGIVPAALKVLKTHKDDDSVIEHCSWLLANVIAPAVEPITSSSSSDDITTIMGVGMQDSSKSAKANASTKVASHTPNSLVVYKNAAHWDLLQSILFSHYSKPQLARWLCAAVCVFADYGGLAHIPLCDIIITVVTRHNEVHSVVLKSLSAVGSLALAHADNCARLTRQQACEITNQILATYSEGEAMCIGAFHAIHGLCYQNPVNQQRFSNMPKLCFNLARSLFYELESEIVSLRGCDAISSLACKHPGNQSKLSHSCNYLADIITAHKGSPTVVLACCRAISNMCHGHVSNRNKLGSIETCENLPQSLILYMRLPTVTLWALRAIADLAANNANNQTKLGNNGACEAIVNVMKLITTEDGTYITTKFTAAATSTFGLGLSFLTSTSPPTLPFSVIPFSQGITAPAIPATAAAGTGAAAGAGASTSERRVSFTTAGAERRQSLKEAAPSAVEVDRSCPYSSEECEALSKWVCWALGNIMQLGKGAATLIDEGTNSKKPPGVLRSASTITKNSTRLASAGAPQALIALLEKYAENGETVQWGARAVNNIAKSRSLSAMFIESQAMDVLDDLLTKHSSNSAVEYWLKAAKETLSLAKASDV